MGEWREWMREMAVGAPAHKRAMIAAALEDTADVPPWATMDPPSGKEAVYITTDLAYARWYAAKNSGDLYEVEPVGRRERSDEDPFPTWTVPSATIVRVIERGVRLVRSDRRALKRRWKKADKRRIAARAAQ
jgi:hypothetical protein